MAEINVVTTFGKEGSKLYGERFCRQFVENSNVPLHVFVDEDGWTSGWFEPDTMHIHHFGDEPELETFLHWCAVRRIEDVGKLGYMFQADRFAWKVFAYTSNQLPTMGWRVWMDADVEIFAPLDLDGLLDEHAGADVIYLGRPHWRHSETGFIAFNLDTVHGRALLFEMRRMYTSRDIFKCEEFHDAWVFDVARSRIRPPYAVNICTATEGLEAWAFSPLGAVSRHNKGALKIKRADKIPTQYQ